MGKRLLILGAGGHGKVAREIALSMQISGVPVYEKIDFLDDNAQEAIGTISEIERYREYYDEIFCGIGNNKIREKFLNKARKLNFEIPVLVHPTAYVSPTSRVQKGTVIEPMAIINANSRIEEGCIISVGAIVDHDVKLGKYVHINAGAICKAGSKVENYKRIDAGKIVSGF